MVYRLHRAMESYDREAAGRALGRVAPGRPITGSRCTPGMSWAATMPTTSSSRAAIDELLKHFRRSDLPARPGRGAARTDRRTPARVAEAAEFSPSADLIFAQQYAQELASDQREHAPPSGCCAGDRKPAQPRRAVFHLANLLWDQQRSDEGLELFRFAACLDDSSDGLARQYLQLPPAVNRTDVVVRLLETASPDSVSGQPARPHALLTPST